MSSNYAMLSKYATRSLTFFAVEFEPLWGLSLGQAVEEVRNVYHPPLIAQSANSFALRWPEDRGVLVISNNRVQVQTLGLNKWEDRAEDWVAMVISVLNALKVEKAAWAGFRVIAYIPLEMSHAEMSRLMFGSFLMPVEEFQQVFDDPDDPVVQIKGKRGSLECQVVVTAANRLQITEGFSAASEFGRFSRK